MTAKRLKPAKQGQLDGACGFYSIVNAIHLLEPELPPQELFSEAISAFIQDGDPMAFVEGTRRGTVKNVLSRVIGYIHSYYELTDDKTNQPYQLTFSIPYWVKDTERSRQDVIDILGQSNYRKGTVCILGYEMNDGVNSCKHWTVIKGFKDDNVITHDSGGGAKKISLNTVRVDSKLSKHSQRPFNFLSEDIFVIQRVIE